MDIILIRHGEKEDDHKNISDLKLTLKGHMQAKSVGQRLKDFGIHKIYSSDFLRTEQTTNEINSILNLNVVYDHSLREIDMGVCNNGWNGAKETYPDFYDQFKKHNEDIPYPEGESGLDVWKRVSPILKRIIGECQNTAIVTHGGTIRCIVAGIMKMDFEKRFLLGSPVHNCGITILRYDNNEDYFSLQLFNDNKHIVDDNLA